MKVAYVYARSDTVGAGTYVHVRDMSRAMLERGHEAVVIVGQEGPVTEELKALGVPVRSLRHLVRPIRPFTDFKAVWEVRSMLEELRPDLLSLHSSKAGIVGRVAGRMLGLPTLYTSHGWSFADGVPLAQQHAYASLERLVAPLAHKIIGVCEQERRQALRFRVTLPHRLLTIHNGMPEVSPSLRACPGMQPPRIVMVARFAEPKDHPTLLRALAGLQHLDWTLDLLGDGPLQSQVEGLVEALGLGSRVRLLGVRTDVDEQLAEAQVFTLITNWEGFPRSILEAMRAGLPVLASDVGGVREAVLDGETGYVVPRGDAGALRERLRRVLEDPQRRTAMGQAGRSRYEAAFTFERMFEKTFSLYEALLRPGAIAGQEAAVGR